MIVAEKPAGELYRMSWPGLATLVKQVQAHPKMHPNLPANDFLDLKSGRQKCQNWLCCKEL